MADLILDAPIQYEPLKKNRWVLRFPNDIGVKPFMLKSVDSPKVQNTSVEIPFMNTSTFVKGRTVWQTMGVVIRDFIAPASRQALIEWFRLHHESVTGRDGYAVGYKKNIELELLDPTGVTVSKWLCENCMIVDQVDFGGMLEYSDDAIIELSFTIQPDRCILLF